MLTFYMTLSLEVCYCCITLLQPNSGDWYSKRQATVVNATYRSEFVAAKTANEQIVDLRQTLRYLGVPIKSKAYMFGDNNLL